MQVTSRVALLEAGFPTLEQTAFVAEDFVDLSSEDCTLSVSALFLFYQGLSSQHEAGLGERSHHVQLHAQFKPAPLQPLHPAIQWGGVTLTKLIFEAQQR